MRRLWFSIIGVLAAAAIAIGINLFADARLGSVQADLTASHLYTLSDGTKQIIAGLKEPVTLRLFYSRKLGATVPSYGTYADHVREMLRDYASLSHGKVKVEYYEGKPISVELPPGVEMKVMETEPGIKSGSVSNVGKPAKMETGLIVSVPQFINEGDMIRVSTADGSYQERVS